jgi:hypothetical protein
MRIIIRLVGMVGIISFLMYVGARSALFVHKTPCRRGSGLCQLRGTTLPHTWVNKGRRPQLTTASALSPRHFFYLHHTMNEQPLILSFLRQWSVRHF